MGYDEFMLMSRCVQKSVSVDFDVIKPLILLSRETSLRSRTNPCLWSSKLKDPRSHSVLILKELSVFSSSVKHDCVFGDDLDLDEITVVSEVRLLTFFSLTHFILPLLLVLQNDFTF